MSDKIEKKTPALSAEEEAELPSRRSGDKKLWICLAILAASVVALIASIPSGGSKSGIEADKEILSGTVERGDIRTVFRGSGSLTDNSSVDVSLPDSVEILSYTVKNGDSVKQGDILSRADRSSVMEAASALQSAMDALDTEIHTAGASVISSYIAAKETGTVEEVYVKAGDALSDVMAQHGALMVIALDDLFAVDIPLSDGIVPGSALTVVTAEGKELAAAADKVDNGTVTVTVKRAGLTLGDTVSVTDGSGRELGSGALRLNRSVDVTGFVGRAVTVYVKKGSQVYPDEMLVSLEELDYDGEYDALLKKRDEYADMMDTLMKAYATGYVTAPCDGIVTGIEASAKYEPLSARSLPVAAEPLRFEGDAPRIMLLSAGDDPEPSEPPEPSPEPPEPTPQPKTYSVTGVVESYEPEKSITLAGAGSFDISSAAEGKGIEVGKTVTVTLSDGVAVRVELASQSDDPGGGGQGGISFSFSIGGMGGGSAAAAEEPAYELKKSLVCSLIPRDIMTVSVAVDELDILSLREGAEAQVSLDAVPGHSFPGTVTKISRSGSGSSGTNTKYSLTVTVERDELMLGGMNASVIIPEGTTKYALLIPAAAICEKGGRSYVYTAYDAKKDVLGGLTEITTGLSDGENVQVLSGLEEGDRFWYEYADSLIFTFG